MAQEVETKNDVFCAGAIIMFFIGLREFGIRKLLKKVGNLAIIL